MPDIWEGKFTKDVSRNPWNAPFLKHHSNTQSSQLLCQCNRVGDIYSPDLLWAKWGSSKLDADVAKEARTSGVPRGSCSQIKKEQSKFANFCKRTIKISSMYGSRIAEAWLLTPCLKMDPVNLEFRRALCVSKRGAGTLVLGHGSEGTASHEWGLMCTSHMSRPSLLSESRVSATLERGVSPVRAPENPSENCLALC